MLNELNQNGVEVYALCRKDSANVERIKGMKNVQIINCGMEEIEQLPDLCEERAFDVLYHLAWRGASGEERTDSVIQAENIVWNLKIARVAKKIGAKKLVVTGTVCENQCEAILRQQSVGKSAHYLLAKRAAHELLSVECRKADLPLAWCTFYHPIGKFNKPEQLIMNTILKLHRGESPKFGPADKLFDVISAEDLCHGLYLAGMKNLSENRYFIGSGKPRPLRDYLYEIQEVVNPDIPLQIGAYPDDGLPMEKSWLMHHSFSMETGYVAKKDFKSKLIEIYSEVKNE